LTARSGIGGQMVASGERQNGRQVQDFVEEWARCANSMVESWSGLGKRLVKQGSDEPDFEGPLQDIWMTMASAAGDFAALSYKWVEAIDGLAGFSKGGSRTDAPPRDPPSGDPPAGSASRGGRSTGSSAKKGPTKKSPAK
jgi:hypothetical protein